MKHDLYVAETLQIFQIFDTDLLPWYLPKVLVTFGCDPDRGKSGPMVSERCKDVAGPVVTCAFPTARPRLEQSSIRSNLSQISGEIENTKTRGLTVHRA